METISTPRVTCPYLNNYIGQTIIIVGKVTQLKGDSADLDADGIVTASLTRDTHLTHGNGVQIIGKVNPDLTIRTLTALDLGDNIDFGLANIVAEISQQYKEIHSF